MSSSIIGNVDLILCMGHLEKILGKQFCFMPQSQNSWWLISYTKAFVYKLFKHNSCLLVGGPGCTQDIVSVEWPPRILARGAWQQREALQCMGTRCQEGWDFFMATHPFSLSYVTSHLLHRGEVGENWQERYYFPHWTLLL